MTVDPADKAPPRLELPGGNGAWRENAWQKPASPRRLRQSGEVAAAFSAICSRYVCGAIVAGGVYLALMQEIPGFS